MLRFYWSWAVVMSKTLMFPVYDQYAFSGSNVIFATPSPLINSEQFTAKYAHLRIFAVNINISGYAILWVGDLESVRLIHLVRYQHYIHLI